MNLGKCRNLKPELYTVVKLCSGIRELSNQMKQLNGLFSGFNKFVYTHLWAEYQSQRLQQEHL